MLRTRTLAALLLLAAPLAAQNALDTFTGGVNQGGWTFGADSAIAPHGGNPDAWVHTTILDTFAPQFRTTGTGGPFTGNWRAMGVHSFGVDLITISTQFQFDRECTLELSNGTQTVYYLGSANHVPQPGTGWKSFEFTFDPASTTMPPGWALFDVGDPDTAWNAVITNVKTINIFYGDPTFFFIFDVWNVGADNARISAQPVWTDLGQALAGASGAPALSGSGQLVPNSQLKLNLKNAAHSAPATLIIGLSQIDAPFKGGVLVPSVDLLASLVTSSTGAITLASTWPTGLPSGTALYLQMWVTDAGGPKGFAASNALKATSP